MGSSSFAIAMVLAVSTGGCSDEVVGQFSGETLVTGGSGDEIADTSSGSSTSTSSDATGSADATSEPGSSTGEQPTWLGGCFVDDFDDEQLDETLWFEWNEGDAAWNEAGGRMNFDPATGGVLDAGLIANHEHTFTFDHGHTRMQITAPPDPNHPVAVFLQIIEEPYTLSIDVSEAEVTVGGRTADGGLAYQEHHPELGMPSWIGIRAEGPLVHYEISDDGVNWTTVATHERHADFRLARPLVMVQTHGDNPNPQIVAVDNFEACIE